MPSLEDSDISPFMLCDSGVGFLGGCFVLCAGENYDVKLACFMNYRFQTLWLRSRCMHRIQLETVNYHWHAQEATDQAARSPVPCANMIFVST